MKVLFFIQNKWKICIRTYVCNIQRPARLPMLLNGKQMAVVACIGCTDDVTICPLSLPLLAHSAMAPHLCVGIYTLYLTTATTPYDRRLGHYWAHVHVSGSRHAYMGYIGVCIRVLLCTYIHASWPAIVCRPDGQSLTCRLQTETTLGRLERDCAGTWWELYCVVYSEN